MKNDVFSFKNLLRAYYQCRKNKRRTINAAKFELNFENELLKLELELKNRTYQSGRSICFAVTEPKLREVFAADFRDRVVHHLLVNYLEPIFEPKFIHASFACRKNKGALKAVETMQKFIRQVADNGRLNIWYIHVDVSAFFTSLNRLILYNTIKHHVKNPDILWLARKIIFHNPTDNYYIKGDKAALAKILPYKSLFSVPAGQGLPIGNLTSQFFANVYLNELDQFAKHKLKIKYYIRYVDDIVMLAQNPDKLKLWRRQINRFLHNHLRLRLQPDKEILQRIGKGVNFLGYIVKPNQLLVRNRTVRKFKNKLFLFNRCFPDKISANSSLPISDGYNEKLNHMLSSANSYYGLFRHADTFSLRQHLYKKHFNILKNFLESADNNYSYFKLNNQQMTR